MANMDLRSRARAAAPALAAAVALAGLTWLAVLTLLPPLAGMEAPVDRLILALKCICVAILLTFVTGIEAVSHERLLSAAFDPISGQESHRLRVNSRYLQNTLEQLMLFIPGLMMLAVFSDSGGAMRRVIAATLVWLIARGAFWVGYHLSPRHRVAGLVGMLQSILILIYLSARIGNDVAGLLGATALPGLFIVAEIVIFSEVSRR